MFLKKHEHYATFYILTSMTLKILNVRLWQTTNWSLIFVKNIAIIQITNAAVVYTIHNSSLTQHELRF